MSDSASFTQLVVIGASAGGITALSTLVATLPTDIPAPIVIAQHLDARRPSHLGEILAARSTLPVRVAGEREALRPGVIYVIPEDRHVEIADRELILHQTQDGRPKPSIDTLFRSAATVFGEGLIAVILTGTGSDGAAGAREVKEAGGTVIIQNPETASFPGMPQSLAPTTVDIEADIENMGQILHDLLVGDYARVQPDEERMLHALLDQLRGRTGIDFSAYKTPTIMRRLQRRMAATGTEKVRDYLRYMQLHPEEQQRLVSAFLIKVTEFFRDPDLFEYLRTHVLPGLIAEARTRGNELRLWSAGCATGEEAYRWRSCSPICWARSSTGSTSASSPPTSTPTP